MRCCQFLSIIIFRYSSWSCKYHPPFLYVKDKDKLRFKVWSEQSTKEVRTAPDLARPGPRGGWQIGRCLCCWLIITLFLGRGCRLLLGWVRMKVWWKSLVLQSPVTFTSQARINFSPKWYTSKWLESRNCSLFLKLLMVHSPVVGLQGSYF